MKSIFKLTLLVFGLVLFSCTSDNNDPEPTCSDGILNGDETGVDCGGSCEPCELTDLNGEISENLTLDASVEYALSGSFIVRAPAELTIPAGTVIKATGGTSSYIGVEQGAKINVDGTANSPVIMTSGEANPSESDWGGLVIAGKAPINNGATAVSEVGELTYGGTAADDNSGTIRYLRVEYSGAAFNSEKEFNGVSLFGVGSGTTFEYIQAYEAGDDGIEFFGGTVDGNNLVVTNSYDDGIDFADGWNGNGTNWYISGAAKGAIEGSHNGTQDSATPVTTTNLSNITVVGPVTEGALYYKEGGGKWTVDNVYASGVNLGVRFKDSDAGAMTRLANGDLQITNIQFADVASGFEKVTGGSSPSWLQEGIATGAGSGAAAPGWTAGWTRGLENSAAATQENLEGSTSTEVTLNANVEYLLTSSFIVEEGGVLNIPAGTVIKATGGTSSYIGVAQGAKINVDGTANSPVIMT
ncbi:MAG: hypothetical protein ACPF99_03425, partial [Flavobacteriaceae bacterium]